MGEDRNSQRIEERVTFALRDLFEAYGYKRFRMSRFERYELYAGNRDFLQSDRMITFPDTDGTLLALKPDVTISIIKNAPDRGGVRKICYDEHVYRPPRGSRSIREIPQAGLECMGEIDGYHVCEVLLLAAKSLALIHPEFVLAVSHLGLLSGLLAEAGVMPARYGEVLELLRHKNTAALGELLTGMGLSPAALSLLTGAFSTLREGLAALMPICPEGAGRQALSELDKVEQVLSAAGYGSRVRLDFSVGNDMDYYNGIVFRGFVAGVPTGVLSGGRYDLLMYKMGKQGGALGFAVYLDELAALDHTEYSVDAEVLLLYGPKDDPAAVLAAVDALTANGARVLAQREAPEEMNFSRVIRYSEGDVR